MADWSLPTLTSTYTNFLSQLQTRDTDLALQFDGTTTSNQPTGTIRWDSSAGRWKKWTGSAWGELAATYALTALSTTGNATIGGTLGVTGATTLATATATTPATADNSTNVATTAFVKAQAYAPLASPTLTGTPAAPTAAVSTNTTQIATTAFTLAQISNDAVLKSGATMTGALTLSGDPTSDLHAVPRQWVQSLAPKASCRVATTANITLSGTQTIDGISLSIGDRVLVKSQTTTSENGIYVVASGAWSRANDADLWNDLVGAYTTVEQGTANDDTFWMCQIARGGTLGTTAITFQLISNAQIASLGLLGTSGIVARTAANTITARSIAVSGTGLSVSNADGVSGNPTVTSNATDTNTASAIVARDASGNFSAGTITLGGLTFSGNIDTSSTGYIDLPTGTTAQRPGSPNSGMIRFNSTTSFVEYYDGAAWNNISSGSSSSFTSNVTITTASQPQVILNSTASGSWKSYHRHHANGIAKWEYGVDSNGNGTNNFYFYDNVAGVNRALIDAVGNLQFNSGYGSAAIAYGCRAWVNFNGTTASPSTMRGNGNVSSVTKNGTGDYTLNFTNAMPDANYSVNINYSPNYGTGYAGAAQMNATSAQVEVASTTTAFRFAVFMGNAVVYDSKYILASVVR